MKFNFKLNKLNNYELVQIVPQIISAVDSSVAIINSKKGTLRPIFFLSIIRFHDIQYDTDPVFIIIPKNTYKTNQKIYKIKINLP